MTDRASPSIDTFFYTEINENESGLFNDKIRSSKSSTKTIIIINIILLVISSINLSIKC